MRLLLDGVTSNTSPAMQWSMIGRKGAKCAAATDSSGDKAAFAVERRASPGRANRFSAGGDALAGVDIRGSSRRL
jgi:hypothetical protein